jgi:hypothetical protein
MGNSAVHMAAAGGKIAPFFGSLLCNNCRSFCLILPSEISRSSRLISTRTTSECTNPIR